MELPLLSPLRRAHAVEHATIAVLLQRRGRTSSVVGFSDAWGFWLSGRFEVDEVASAATEALDRLQAGERHLAITQACGTNVALAGLFAGTAALIGAGRSRRSGWPNALAAAMVASAAAVPAGVRFQRQFTTDADVAGLRIGSVKAVATPVGRAIRVQVGR